MAGRKELDFGVSDMKTVLPSLMDGHVHYVLGAKVWHVKTTEPSKITALDCSGFVKYLVYRTASPKINMPAGSWHQEKWCKKYLRKVDYAKEAPKKDGKVRIAFRDKTPSEIRHVWLVVNGWTIECTTKGGKDGPASLPWSVRRKETKACFLLGQVKPFMAHPFWQARTATP